MDPSASITSSWTLGRRGQREAIQDRKRPDIHPQDPGPSADQQEDLRKQISERLRDQVGVVAGKMEVVESGGRGYRLSDKVRLAGQEAKSVE